MLEKLKCKYIVKDKQTGQYILRLAMPPNYSKLCIEKEKAYKFLNEEWVRKKLHFYRDYRYEVI